MLDDGSKLTLRNGDRRPADGHRADPEGRRVPHRRARRRRGCAAQRGLLHRGAARQTAGDQDDAAGHAITRRRPIEEVTVQVEAKDDFGLKNVELHYSVNGGPEKTVPLPVGRQRLPPAPRTIALEDFKVEPGDVVSLYALAKDARTTTSTDIYFIEAQPFERNYTQSQQAGRRWRRRRRRRRSEQDFAAPEGNHRGHLESVQGHGRQGHATRRTRRSWPSVQSKLRDQAKSLAERMKARQLTESGRFLQELREGHGDGRGGHGAGLGQVEGREVAGRAGAGAEGAAVPDARRSDVPRYPGGVRQSARWRRWRRRGRARATWKGCSTWNSIPRRISTRAISRSPSGQQQQQQQQIDEALQKLEQLAQAAAGTGRPAEERPAADLAAALAAGDAAARGRAVAAAVGTDDAGPAEPAVEPQSAGSTGTARPARTTGPTRSAGPARTTGPAGPAGRTAGPTGRTARSAARPAGSTSSRGSNNRVNNKGSSSNRHSSARMQHQQNTVRGASPQQMQQMLDRLNQAMDDMRGAASSQQAGTPQGEAQARRAADRLKEAEQMLSGHAQQGILQSGGRPGAAGRRSGAPPAGLRRADAQGLRTAEPGHDARAGQPARRREGRRGPGPEAAGAGHAERGARPAELAAQGRHQDARGARRTAAGRD